MEQADRRVLRCHRPKPSVKHKNYRGVPLHRRVVDGVQKCRAPSKNVRKSPIIGVKVPRQQPRPRLAGVVNRSV